MSAITYTVIVFISCVGHRFVFGVAAASPNTRFQAARYDLTWVGLAPADRASSAWRLHSFDHLVGAAEQWQRDCYAKRLGSLEVQEHLDLRGLLNRQLARLFAFENPGGVNASQTVSVGKATAIAHQAAGGDELAVFEDRRHRVADG